MTIPFPSFFNTRFTLALVLVLTLVSASSVFAAVPLTITTDKDTYYAGETIKVTGSTVPNSAVTLQLINPDGTVVAISQVVADSEGNFQTQFVLPATLPYGNYKLGTYTIKAYTLKTTATKEITLATPVGLGLQASWISAPDFAREGSATTFSVNVTYDGVPTAEATVTGIVEPEGEEVEFTYVADGEYRAEYTPATINKDRICTMTVTVTYEESTVTLTKQFYTLINYQSAISEVEESVSSLENTVSTLQETAESLSSSVDNLQTTVSSLQTTVSNLQSTIAAMPSAEDLAALQNSVAALSAQLPALYGLSIIAIIIAIAAIVLLYRKVVK